MKAVIRRSGTLSVMPLRAWLSPYQSDRPRISRIGSGIGGSTAGSRPPPGADRAAAAASSRDGDSAAGSVAGAAAGGLFSRVFISSSFEAIRAARSDDQTALPAYFLRRWLRSAIATRFITVTTTISSRAVAKTSGLVASTLGLWKPTS